MKKSHYILQCSLIFLLSFFSQSSHAQDITDKESQLIIKKSKEILQEYNQLLNLLVSPDIDEETIRELIASSFQKGDGNQIFFSNGVIFEDDINPKHFDYKTANDVALGTYLQNIDLFLEKSNDTTVVFSNVRVSNVKLGEYLYVKVFFKSLFKGKNKSVKTAYRLTERVAEVRAEYVNSKWKLYIMRVSFVTPDDLKNESKNDVDIVETAKIGAKKMNVATILKEKEKRKAMEAERKNTVLFQKNMNTGDSAVIARNYTFAIRAYQRAKEILPSEKMGVDAKIQNTQLLQENERGGLAKKKVQEEDKQRAITTKKKTNEEPQQKTFTEKQRLEKEELDRRIFLEEQKIRTTQKIANNKKNGDDGTVELKKKLLLEKQQKANNSKPIPNEIQRISNYKPLLGVKILVAVMGIYGGYNAYSLKSDYDTKLTTLKDIAETSDPDGDGKVNNDEFYSPWKTAYDDAQTAKGKQGIITASLGITAAAVVVETLLLIRKKPAHGKGISFKSDPQHIGIALNYNF